MKKNILIAAGGTGGHMMPALGIYDHLKKKSNISITSDLRGSKYIDIKKYKITILNTPRILNNLLLFPIRMLIIFFLIIKSIILLKKKKISIIITTGGYAPVPICLAGIILKIKLYIYEPNHVLGKSNKLFLIYCRKIFCHSKNIKKYPKKYIKKIIIISPIVRKIFYLKRRKKIKINKLLKIFIIGGSQSAKIFDKYLNKVLLEISKKNKIKVFHQTSKIKKNSLKNFYDKNNIPNTVFDFDKNIFNKIKDCDFCITRAGSSTLAELFVLNIPFLTVPIYNSKDNHQLENAKFYKNLNCSWNLDEKIFTYEILKNFFKKIIIKKNVLLNKKIFIQRLNKKNTWRLQNNIILKEIYEN